MKTIQLKPKLFRMPILAIFFTFVMFIASCVGTEESVTDGSGTTEFSFADCPADILMQVRAGTDGSFPSSVAISWPEPTVVNSPDSDSDITTGPTIINVTNPPTPATTSLTNGSEFPIQGIGGGDDVMDGDVGFYTVTYTVSSLDAAGETVPGLDCVFQVRLLAGTDIDAPIFVSGACPSGIFNPFDGDFTAFTTDGPDDSEVLFSELMVTLPPPQNNTVPLLVALAGNIMDNLDGAVPLSAITVALSNADMSVTAGPTTADVFGANLELPIGNYTVIINAVDSVGNNTATDNIRGDLCTLTLIIQRGQELEQ